MDAASILSGMGGFVGSMIQSATATGINREQTELAKYGYEQEKEMIREQNEYNSPAKQIERYKEAGLNPNLIYGNGQTSAGNQQGIAQYHAPKLNVPEFNSLGVAEAVGTMIQLKQLELQNKKTDAEVHRMEMENYLTERYINQKDAELSYYNLLHADGVESPAFQDYSAGIRLKNQQFEIGQLEKEYRQAVTIGQSLNNQERRYYNNFLLPLAVQAKQLEIEGMSYENIKRKIDSELWRDLRNVEMQSTPLRAASHLAILFGNSPLGQHWKESLRKASEYGKKGLKKAFRIR